MAGNLRVTVNVHCNLDGFAVRFVHRDDYSEMSIGHKSGAEPLCIFATKEQIRYLGAECLKAVGAESSAGQWAFMEAAAAFADAPDSKSNLGVLVQAAVSLHAGEAGIEIVPDNEFLDPDLRDQERCEKVEYAGDDSMAYVG